MKGLKNMLAQTLLMLFLQSREVADCILKQLRRKIKLIVIISEDWSVVQLVFLKQINTKI